MHKTPEQTISNRLSQYRTRHCFEKYGVIRSVDDFQGYQRYASRNKCQVYVLGNGSNTLFSGKKISTLILKNELPHYIERCGDHLYRVSSACPVAKVLSFCMRNNLNSFYYLASVPATIGGAIAMNAGRGRERYESIFDFLVSVRYVDKSGALETKNIDQIEFDYRSTEFAGVKSALIVDAVFEFTGSAEMDNPIKNRVLWAKEFQDYSEPNCGSVFKIASPRILRCMKGVGIFDAAFSKKTGNWIVNRSDSSLGIIVLISIATMLHRFLLKKSELEIIKVK